MRKFLVLDAKLRFFSGLITEYLRPWKLLTLVIGISLLIVGAFYENAPDWDIPISFIMAFFSYLTAPSSMRILLERRWKQWPIMLFWTWFSVDGCYTIYWYFKNPLALDMMREANFPASLSLYGICGIIWLYQGSFHNLLQDCRRVWQNSDC
jgi:hypothetical protein